MLYIQKHALTLIILIIVFTGILVRLTGLGVHPFSIDEYYLFKSINLIFEKGLPEFLCGGYYVRGILLQYIILPFVSLIDNQELATRLPIVLFSILTLPAVYLIGRDLGSRYIGVLALFLFSFSVWQIEFARFARMYVPFQMLFVWQVWLFINPDKPSRNINILLNGIVASIAILFYEGGIFCVALAFFNLLLYNNSTKVIYYLPTFIATILSGLMISIPFRHLGTSNQYSQAGAIQSTSTQGVLDNLPIDLPSYFIYENFSGLLFFALIIYTIITALFLFKCSYRSGHTLLTKLLLFTIAISCLVNQFFLAACILLIALLLPKSRSDIIELSSNKLPQSYLIITFIWGIICIINFVIANDSHSMLVMAKAIINNFFSYPDIFFDIFKQWQKPMPLHSIFSVICIFITISWCLFKTNNTNYKLHYLLSTLISVTLLIAIINTQYNTSRYSFFISPLILIIISYCIVTAAALLSKNNIISYLLTCVLSISFMYFSEDFRLSHIVKIDSYESNHRVNYTIQYAEHLYPRYDYYSITNYINKNVSSDDVVVISTPVLEMYIKDHVNIDYFITRENNEFISHSSCEGTRELWSRKPLIDNYKDLHKILSQGTHTKWLVLHGERGNPYTTKKHEILKEKVQPFKTYTNEDRTLVLYRIGPENEGFK